MDNGIGGIERRGDANKDLAAAKFWGDFFLGGVTAIGHFSHKKGRPNCRPTAGFDDRVVNAKLSSSHL